MNVLCKNYHKIYKFNDSFIPAIVVKRVFFVEFSIKVGGKIDYFSKCIINVPIICIKIKN